MASNGWILTAALIGGAALLAPNREAVEPAAPAEPQTVTTSANSNGRVGNGYGSVRLERSEDGQFYTDAQVNGARIRFLIDTGSTAVVLTKDDAQRAGVGAGEYSARGVGASGEVRLMPVTLDRLAVGPLLDSNVAAMVADEGLPVSLLGQSWLGKIGTISIEGDEMILR